LSGDTAIFVTGFSGGATRSPFSSRVVKNKNTLVKDGDLIRAGIRQFFGLEWFD
jgi:hypothetical protein